jgi:glycosyltransferase involved in cell wall biosynthesis
VAISQAQLDAAPGEMGGGEVVHNPIDCAEWPYRGEKDEFLLWIGVTGFVVDDEEAMARAVARLGEIEPAACRDACERRFGVAAVVRRYEDVYCAAAAAPA